MNFDGERHSDAALVGVLLLAGTASMLAALFWSIWAPLWIKAIVLPIAIYVGWETNRLVDADIERMRRKRLWMEREIARLEREIERDLAEMRRNEGRSKEGRE